MEENIIFETAAQQQAERMSVAYERDARRLSSTVGTEREGSR